MDDPPLLLDQTPQLHDIEHIIEPISANGRLLLIIFCLVGGLSIACFQMNRVRTGETEVHDVLTRPKRTLRAVRIIVLNSISGILIMMSTSIGTQETSLAHFEADFHSLLDPQLTQIKIDCLRIHAMRWIQYSSGWQILTNLGKHARSLHLWILPVEYLAALAIFFALVMLDGREKRIKLKVFMSLSATVHACFPSYWLLWWLFAFQLMVHNQGARALRPILPVFEPKSHKPSRPIEMPALTRRASHGGYPCRAVSAFRELLWFWCVCHYKYHFVLIMS